LDLFKVCQLNLKATLKAHSSMSDITYIRTKEGFFFLAVVMDLFARTIVVQ